MVRVPLLQVTIYPINSDKSIASNGTTLTGVLGADIRVGIESTKDVYSFKIANNYIGSNDFTWSQSLTKKNNMLNTIKVGDFAEIRASYNDEDITDQSKLLIFGEITDFNYSNDESGPVITFNGTNITENLLRTFGLSTKGANDLGSFVSANIIELVGRINQTNNTTTSYQRKVYAALDDQPINDFTKGITNITGSFGNIASHTSTGGDFPAVTYAKTWQPMFRILEDLAAPEYTGDYDAGNYLFYIKPTKLTDAARATLKIPIINELVFQPAGTNVAHTLVRGVDYSTDTVVKNVDDVVNALIVKPGTTPRGTGITTYAFNTLSMAQYGAKYGYWNKPEIANMVKQKEMNMGSAAGSQFIGFLPGSASHYPWNFKTVFSRLSEFPYTENPSVTLTATNENQYDDIMREEITKRARIEAQRIVETTGIARYGGNVELIYGTGSFQMGKIVSIKENTIGWNDTATDPTFKLRIRDVRHSFDNNGWTTTLVLKEDEKVISERING